MRTSEVIAYFPRRGELMKLLGWFEMQPVIPPELEPRVHEYLKRFTPKQLKIMAQTYDLGSMRVFKAWEEKELNKPQQSLKALERKAARARQKVALHQRRAADYEAQALFYEAQAARIKKAPDWDKRFP